MVIHNGFSHLRTIASIVDDFARISGLHLNIGKTVIVPLFPYLLFDVREQIARTAPQWIGVAVQAHAKHLGYFLGPAKGEQSWAAPLENTPFEPQRGGERG